MQKVVPKVASGVVFRSAGSELSRDKQTARFGSRGEGFAIAQRLR
ncbi:MAG TPA: hypothetical protein VG758_14425 [Hyphomicrobiaceae bacterium]|nr:hypothetical protein [Hyphomicrobiaceae bacterium]